MKKNMYSLMLSGSVVEEIDRLAAEQGTNRSNLVNQILAEYVSLTTPEKRIQSVFDVIERALESREHFLLFNEPNDLTLSIKSALQDRYRPTIRYEVEMYRMPEKTIGLLKVLFRTQAPELLMDMTAFFRLWIRLETLYIHNLYSGSQVEYTLEDGRFTRTFVLPDQTEYDAEQTGQAISGYIAMFDELLKGYLSGKYRSETELENRYLEYLNSGMRII